MSSPNPTGFDKNTLIAAASSRKWQAKDPWQRNERWRYTGPFTRFNRFKRAFPGLGIATVAFAGYLVYEAVFLNDDHSHGHVNGEQEGHH